MKTTLHLYCLTVALFLTTVGFGQSVSKTLVKSFNPASSQLSQIDLNGPVTIESWDSKIIRVQMSVALTNANEQTLKGLIQAGRYNLKGAIENDQFVINAPGLQRAVEINGRALEEEISYIIYLPNGMAAEQVGTSAPTAATDDF